MKLFLTKTEKELLKISKEIHEATRRQELLEEELVIYAINGNRFSHFYTRAEIKKLKESKAELLTILENYN